MRIWLLLLALLTPITAQSHLSLTGPAAVELYELAPMARPAPIIKARSAVLVDLDSGQTLHQLDPHGRHAKAATLGMADTHFANPIGLDDPAHYTSSADLARASAELIRRFPDVAAIAATPSLTLPATATHHAYALYNLNELVRKYPGATGLKTGWTGHAGGCLIATATRDGRHLLVVLLASARIFAEAAALLDYGFASGG